MRATSNWLAISLAAVLAACTGMSETPDASGNHCVAGMVIACPCVGGAMGVQSCLPNGTFGACMCPGADGGHDVVTALDANHEDTTMVDAPTGTDVTSPDSTIEPDVAMGTDVPMGTDVAMGADVPQQTDAQAPDARAGSIFTRCTSNTDCGTGGTCLTTFPGGGICTVRCTRDAACGVDGLCEMTNMICLPSCSSGGGECDYYGGACIPVDTAFTVGLCLPSCYASGAPAGYPACAAPMPMCDAWNGICATMQPTGVDDGGPCRSDSDCRGGRCIAEVDETGAATGWVGGYCLSFARATNDTQGSPVPQSNCPPGAGAVPLNGQGPGDSAPCFRTCNATSDCRGGYQCDHLTPAMGTGNFFTNGICLPVDCRTSGMTCPANYHCVTQPSDAAVPPGQCEAN